MKCANAAGHLTDLVTKSVVLLATDIPVKLLFNDSFCNGATHWTDGNLFMFCFIQALYWPRSWIYSWAGWNIVWNCLIGTVQTGGDPDMQFSNNSSDAVKRLYFPRSGRRSTVDAGFLPKTCKQSSGVMWPSPNISHGWQPPVIGAAGVGKPYCFWKSFGIQCHGSEVVNAKCC